MTRYLCFLKSNLVKKDELEGYLFCFIRTINLLQLTKIAILLNKSEI